MHNLFCVFRPRSLSSFILKWIHRKTWILMTSCAFQWWRGLSFLSLSVDCVLIVIVIVLVLCFWPVYVCFHSLLTFIFQKQKGSSSSSWCEWNKCSGSVCVVNSAYHYHSLLAACLCLSNLIIIIIIVITLLLVLLPTMLSASCLRRNKQITRTKSFQHFIGIGCYCYWN